MKKSIQFTPRTEQYYKEPNGSIRVQYEYLATRTCRAVLQVCTEILSSSLLHLASAPRLPGYVHVLNYCARADKLLGGPPTLKRHVAWNRGYYATSSEISKHYCIATNGHNRGQ